jgi:tetratricopeptide (TPR) repeat protein
MMVAALVLVGCSSVPADTGQRGRGAVQGNGAHSRQQPEVSFREQRFAEAAEAFVFQAKSGATDPHKAWFNAGASYWNAGQKPQALEAYEQAVAVHPLYSKGHLRLTNKYASLDQADLSAKHKKHAKTIQQVTKVMLPHWAKANQLRGRGADYDYAAATIHDACAQYYDEQGLPEFAAAERKLADQSRAAGQAAKTNAGASARQARTDAEDRAFRTEVFGTLKDLTATVTNVDPVAPFSSYSGGRSETKMAVAGLGVLEQSFGAYANTMQMFEPQLQAQREAVRQQGQQAQAALADPHQAQLQRSAQQRTMELQQKLAQMEEQAMQYLAAEGLLDESEPTNGLDSLDL